VSAENFTKGRRSLTLSPVQSPRKLETLDDLLAQAEHYAAYSMAAPLTNLPHGFPVSAADTI